jgi:hypothetical protein
MNTTRVQHQRYNPNTDPVELVVMASICLFALFSLLFVTLENCN